VHAHNHRVIAIFLQAVQQCRQTAIFRHVYDQLAFRQRPIQGGEQQFLFALEI
jgi:hypothetical protein